jgi:RHS repeat-associated protein
VDILFAFTGRDRDEETGLQYHRARYYDPTPGRWLSEDPKGFAAGDSNLDRYVKNAPIGLIDPSGLDWLDVYAEWFNSVFGTGYSATLGGVIHGTVTVGADYYLGISDETLANAGPWTLAFGTAVVSTPIAFGILYGGEVMLGVGTYGAVDAGAVTTASATGGAVVAGATSTGGIVLNGGSSAAAGMTATGVGTTAVTTPFLPEGIHAAIMINGTVYVARFHNLAWDLAGRCGQIQIYGMVEIDKAGKVIRWVDVWKR